MPDRTIRPLIAGYAGLLIWLAGRLPFWLDEVLMLIGTTRPDFAGAFAWVIENPGAAPLGYLTQHAVIAVLGFTRISARLAPALFSALAAIVLAGLARDLGLRSRTAALVAFLIVPIQLRYAVEGRPYSQAMFFAVAATWCLWRLAERPSWRLAILYTLLVAAGLYSQTFAQFVQFGAIAAIAIFGSRRNAVIASAALFSGYLLYLPWYFYSKAAWQNEIVINSWSFVAGPKFALLVIRELAGGGYAVSIPLLIAAALGFRALEPRVRWFLAGGVLTGVFFAIAADAWFDYFFAIRQVLFAVPALVLLAAEGFGSARRRWLGLVLAGVFACGSALKNFAYFSHANEDWEAAAAAIEASLGPDGCLVMTPREERRLYTLFKPSLSSRFCGAAAHPLVIAAANPYTPATELRALLGSLESGGYRRERELQAGGTRMLFYRRP